ncbi:MAG: malonyl-ACP O-methyltransferase BioC [Gammaproteobacteria bacterium]
MLALDNKTVRQAFNRAASSYDEYAILHRELAQRLMQRLELIKIAPKNILDLGAGTGYLSQLLHQRFPTTNIYNIDFAEKLLHVARTKYNKISQLHAICADISKLPIISDSVDMVVSSMTLQWIADLPLLFSEVRRVLHVNGLFMFTTVGPDTLKEIRHAWQHIDRDTHVHEFIDMHDIGDMLQAQRFLDPVMDAYFMTLTYSSIANALNDIRKIGAYNNAQQRPRTLMGKQRYHDFLQAYEQYRNAQGKIPVSYEIVSGHAWKSQPASRMEDGIVKIDVNQIKRTF